jgi:hypothetical protein
LPCAIGMPSEEPTKNAFLSYARKDTQFVLRLVYDLRAGGADLWLDQLDIKQGERWDRAIEDALAKSPRLLVVLSPAAVKSNNVMDEVSFALEHGKTVLPVICRNCKIPFRLRRVQYEDLSKNYEAGLGRVLARLGVVAPLSEIPEATRDQDLGGSSDHRGGAEEVTVLSQTAPQDQKPTPPTLIRRVLHWIIMLIAIACLLVSYALLRGRLPPKVIAPLEKNLPKILREIPKVPK